MSVWVKEALRRYQRMKTAFNEAVGSGNTKRALQVRKVNQIIKENLEKDQPFPLVDIIYDGKSRKEERLNGGSKLYLNQDIIEDILEDESKARSTIKKLL